MHGSRSHCFGAAVALKASEVLKKRSSFVFSEDAKGDHFVSMAHDEATKNHQGGVSDVESFEKNARMYNTSGIPLSIFSCRN